MRLFTPLILLMLFPAVLAADSKTLPALHDGIVVSGPGTFRHDGELRIQGHVTLRNLNFDLRGPVRVAESATLELDGVQITVSDPPGSANGASRLGCDGPAHFIIRKSMMEPAGSAHPIWVLKGTVDVDDFQTKNSEFHFDHVQAQLKNLKIFELEISRGSQVVASHLRLVFLSTHTGDDDHLKIDGVPADAPFTRVLGLGSGAKADLNDTTAELFLVYVHGKSEVQLSRMGRMQLAMFPQCAGTLSLPRGHLGSAEKPVVVPTPGTSNCPFRFSLVDVNVDTWDVYASGNAQLTFTHSLIDELTVNDHAKLMVRDSELYADWLAVAGDAELKVERSTVGALRLASKRPDLATSQVRLSGRSHATFSQVRFDCGVVASENSQAEIENSVVPPQYVRKSGNAAAQIRPAARTVKK